uniref:Large ribosomal subunit protein uL23c n=2 Tax=Taiwania TaxID=25613 RepID=R4L0A1_9CONI|nr:ribosomal protein L23 [Taiwania cryptomerioides]YP_008082425.1 ribosomal protein L23 [Taiwania flousiana]AGL11271.1 ribosomal protein L23 [Taiwania flousiana]AVR43517.1 ribosomal protein L23 [Taiwania cryptomerioides]QJE37036.1 ribosomal protein L23 [Taiwania flousiana]QJE37119.1 ribosomal protein L23 [Taiwania flousiana]BAK86841.1 ribosomal protein L23 [Taiwania cryptomerioides]
MYEVQYLDLVLTEKSFNLFQKNQYIFNVDSRSNKTKIKNWIELFFNVKVIGVNSYRPPQKKERKGNIKQIMKHRIHYKRMIITLKPGYSIPLFPSKSNLFN